MPSINKILIANRGEIAVRIINTCRSMGILSVAVYSEADKNSIHVKLADEAVFIGKSAARESYLDIDKIIEAAKSSRADAIHPGYGFLSENAQLALRCEKENIIFIGPSSIAIEKMGSKAGAKKLVKSIGVPVVPGYAGDDQSNSFLLGEAEKIGFPVLIKASAGGGGKGMRIVRRSDDFLSALDSAKREAKSAFGDDRLILEKYFDSCRHVEVQVFGDQHGNVIHLFERECTIQRRHQKIIEESPSPALSSGLRKQMTEAAVMAAKAINYSNAGTVEFIVVPTAAPGSASAFYFLEVNTRLQVEHPVTEMITGLDLVKIQIEVAAGKQLPQLILPPEKPCGYALECRLYAEDPRNNFLPQTGKIVKWKPAEIENARFDSGIESGDEIGIYYDPMLAKIIAWGNDREEAIRKMSYALQNTVCLGISTNKDFLIRVLNNQKFKVGDYDTHFIEKNKGELMAEDDAQSALPWLIAALLFQWGIRERNRTTLMNLPSGWKNNRYSDTMENYVIDDKEHKIEYRFLTENKFAVQDGNKKVLVEYGEKIRDEFKFFVDGEEFHALAVEVPGERFSKKIVVHLFNHSEKKLALVSRFPEKKKEEIKGSYKSPMPGEVVKISVKQGDEVKKGDLLMVLLSMKMENSIVAHSDGKVEEVLVTEKYFVQADTVLLKIDS